MVAPASGQHQQHLKQKSAATQSREMQTDSPRGDAQSNELEPVQQEYKQMAPRVLAPPGLQRTATIRTRRIWAA